MIIFLIDNFSIFPQPHCPSLQMLPSCLITSYKGGCYLGPPKPLIQCSRLPQHQEPLKASEQLLVCSNGLPLLGVVVFTLRHTEAVCLVASVNSTHPSAILPLYMGDAWGATEDQRHFSSLLYRATKMANSHAVLQKQPLVRLKIIIIALISFSKNSLQTRGRNRTSYHLERFQEHSRKDSDSR